MEDNMLKRLYRKIHPKSTKTAGSAQTVDGLFDRHTSDQDSRRTMDHKTSNISTNKSSIISNIPESQDQLSSQAPFEQRPSVRAEAATRELDSQLQPTQEKERHHIPDNAQQLQQPETLTTPYLQARRSDVSQRAYQPDLHLPSAPEIVHHENGKRMETQELFRGGADAYHGRTPSINRTTTFPPEGPQQDASTPIRTDPGGHETPTSQPLQTSMNRSRRARSPVAQSDLSNIFPKEIKCLLNITFEERRILEDEIRFPDFVWYETKSYKKLEGHIQKIKDIFRDQCISGPSRGIYLRYASCFVKGLRGDRSKHTLDDECLIELEVLADAAIKEICGFIRDYPYQPFVLHLRCDCSFIPQLSAFDELGAPTKNFHYEVRQWYGKKMSIGRKTIKDQEYFSHADQQALVTPEIASLIIDEDQLSRNKLTPRQKKDLKFEVGSRPAYTLQAVCIFGMIPMRFLYHILCEQPHAARRHSDDLQTLHLDNRNICEDELCVEHHKTLCDNVYKFYPETIKPDAKHSIKPPKAIVPVRYKDESKKALGSGAYSTVYEVEIDPYYQLISPDVTQTYALKTFRTEPRYKRGFDREITMLLELARRHLAHEHIQNHLTSWEQDEIYYILYDKAHGNLRQHMDKTPGGDFSQERVLWLFHQILGISDAISTVHSFTESDVNLSPPGDKKTGVVGRHHDIKPENILTFGQPEDLPTLKLSDFGSGKFSVVRAWESGDPPTEPRGTRTYLGPECQREWGRRMTRPFDMWAVGCVFMEVLLWFCAISRPDNERSFQTMRLADQTATASPLQGDYFWVPRRAQHLGGADTYALSPAAEMALDLLQFDVCQRMPVFQDLIQLIRTLLAIEPDDRLLAAELCGRLKSILVRVQIELEHNPEVYSAIYQDNQTLTTNFTIQGPRSEGMLTTMQTRDADVSTTGESRVESARNLLKLDNGLSASQPPVRGDASTPLAEIGQQFLSASDDHGAALLPDDNNDGGNDNDDHDDDDDDGNAIFMSDKDQPNPILREMVVNHVRSVHGV